jgi:hypothetical protein
MRPNLRLSLVLGLVVLLISAGVAQQAKKTGILDSTELKPLVPTNFFYDGQTAPVQLRNSVAIRLADGKLVLAGLVDTSGYATEVVQKYQGFFVTETKLDVENSSLAPGQYGFGFGSDGKFHVMDVGGNDVLTVAFHQDENLKRPAPLKAAAEGGNYRLYAGKKYVTVSAK